MQLRYTWRTPSSTKTVRARLLEGFTSVPPCLMTPKYTAQFQNSTDVLVEMRDGMLRSIPQHIGYVTRKPFTYPSEKPSGLRTPTSPFDGPHSLTSSKAPSLSQSRGPLKVLRRIALHHPVILNLHPHQPTTFVHPIAVHTNNRWLFPPLAPLRLRRNSSQHSRNPCLRYQTPSTCG
jgi:hypothetical protein